MKLKMLFLPIIAFTSVIGVNAQVVTQSFKPGPSVGQDAYLMNVYNGCIFTSDSLAEADTSHGNTPDFSMDAWTWSSQGCDSGMQRALIRFIQLNTIPTNATIISATLKLKTPSTMPGYTAFPGNHYPNGSNNKGTLYRVSPGSTYNWNESVTWNQFVPLVNNIVTSSAVPIPTSTGQYNTTLSLNVTNIVQNIVSELGSNAYANNGFYLKLNNEIHYRSQMWASSDYPDSTYWPELVVTYDVCDPSFSYSSSTSNPYTYTFTMNNTSQTYHDWDIDGIYAGNGTTLTYTFPGPGSHVICLHTSNTSFTSKCEYCFKLCVDENIPSLGGVKTKSESKIKESIGLYNKAIPGDGLPNEKNINNIVPNPTSDGWNIQFQTLKSGQVTVNVIDQLGRVVATNTVMVNKGMQHIYQNAQQLNPGIYFIEVKGAGIDFREKGIKQ